MTLVLYKDIDFIYYNSVMLINRSAVRDGDRFYSLRYRSYECTNLNGRKLKELKRRE